MLRVFAIILVILFSITNLASAKDLAHRLGVGYKNQFSNDLPGMAAQYYPNPEIGLSGVMGLDTQKNQSRFGFMVKIHRIIFQEENLNFYMGGGAGLISSESTVAGVSSTESGFEMSAFSGAEFFLPGLDNLGLSFEAGIGVTSVSGSGVRFRTFGDSPIRAGFIFYF